MPHSLLSYCHVLFSWINKAVRSATRSNHIFFEPKRPNITIAGRCFLLLLLSFSAPAAAVDYSTDNNCSDITLSDMQYKLGDVTSVDANTTNVVNPAFALGRVPPETCKNKDGDVVACDTYCNSETRNAIKFCYDTSITSTSPASAFTANCSASKILTLTYDQDLKTSDNNWFQAILVGDTACIQVYSKDSANGNGWITLGCKKDTAAAEDSANNHSGACYVDDACTDGASRHTKTFFSPSSIVVECIEHTLRHIFIDSGNCPGRTNLFTTFQNTMRKTIGVALALYVIFFGIKIILGQEVPSKGELFWFALKMILVIYFSIGDGVQSFLYPTLVDSMFSMSQMMYQAGNSSYDAAGNVISRGLCEFSTDDYPEFYKNMALFDSIDCRIGVYLLISPKGAPMFLLMLFPALFSGQIFLFIFSMIFGIFLLSIMIFVVHNFIISLIVLTLVTYLAPLFVPLALFSYTKKFYDNWIKSLLFGMLQPLVLFAFVALTLTVFDQLFYADCTFRNTGDGLANYVVNVNGASDECKASAGYQMSLFAAGDMVNFSKTFFGVWKLNYKEYASGIDTLVRNLMTLTLFLYLIYYFVRMLSNMAEDLVGGPQARALVSTSPMGLVNAAASKLGSGLTAMNGSGGSGPGGKDGKGAGEGDGDGDNASEDGDDAPVAGEEK